MSVENIKLKEVQVKEIEEKINKAKTVVIVDYRGLTVAQDTELRANLRKANVEYKVLKNRLVLRALNNTGHKGFDKALEGPTAVAFSYDDVIAPAKIVVETMSKVNKMALKGGLIEGNSANEAQMKALALIPGREVLLGQLVGLLTSPMRSLAVGVSEIAKKNA